MSASIHQGDCLEILRGMADASVDSVVTDPPYGLSFMGKKWDYDVPSEDIWRECLRVLKPGGHLLAFAGTRTQHRMAVNIEDSGFEVRDLIAWVYGSGFPKSLDVSKAIDKAAGAQREVVGPNKFAALNGKANVNTYGTATRPDQTAPTTDAARQWRGWGTALKPALEPITLARKPLVGTVADNVLAHATGGINVDGCRVSTTDTYSYPSGAGGSSFNVGGGVDGSRIDTPSMHEGGRWPANLIHDGSDEVVGLFPQSQSAGGQASLGAFRNGDVYGKGRDEREARDPGYGDSGSAARFFYCAKASKADRAADNNHPTVKPTALMRYLCRLVTPPRGIVLDPFMGSGSTGKAAILEGFQFIGIEREQEYVAIAKARIAGAEAQRLEMLPLEGVAA